ncbi:ATP-grasp domain-containing protein [Amycolatopsis anabasis]|uniref:ATP-grasp domain-containing protein n=1 Tax=Amycolatopsis anabasis TaxID=1840409 RepID=UPI001C5560A4|nr:ATP-grasp domain-containing protein [Amycolatopsis anabasis]
MALVTGEPNSDCWPVTTVGGWSLEDLGGVRRRWNATDLDDLVRFAAVSVNAVASPDRPALIVPWAPSPAWTVWARTHPEQADIADFHDTAATVLTNKIVTREWLRRSALPVPRSVAALADAVDIDDITGAVGLPCVLQEPTGSVGSGTYLAFEDTDFQRIVTKSPQVPAWLISSFTGDVIVNYHGVVFADAAIVTAPSIQLTGIAEVGAEFGTHCGNIFGATDYLGEATRFAGELLTYRIGAWLHELGYRGAFGADFVLTPTGPVLLEINARLQTSTGLLAELEAERGHTTVLDRHVRAALGQHRGADVSGPVRRMTQLVVHWTGSDQIVEHSPPLGLYRLDGTDLLSRAPGLTGLPDAGTGEIRLQATPRPGTRLAPGATLARLTASTDLTVPDGTELTPFGRRCIAAVRRAVR